MRSSTNFFRISSNIIIIVLLWLSGDACCDKSEKLRTNFYKYTCPRVEEIARKMTWNKVAKNSSLPPKFLRMQFHDCFVRGCEASILLDSTKNNTAEKDSSANVGLIGSYELIDEIKAKLEKICPGVVSCADILNLVTRDSVSYEFKKSLWKVKTGRRDGRVSRASEIPGNLPPPSFTFSSLKQSFANKTLSVHDLVVLSGGHTIGRAHCSAFANRLYNFTGFGDADPSLDPSYATHLRTRCLSISDNVTTVEMDPDGQSLFFDPNYYRTLVANKGLFQSDAALLTNREARELVLKLQNPKKFFEEFGNSMQKMTSIGVLTGTQGEIRHKCNVVNAQYNNHNNF